MILVRIPLDRIRDFQDSCFFPLATRPRASVNEILLIESDVDGEDDPVVHMAARYSHLSRIRSDSATNVYGEPAEVLLHINRFAGEPRKEPLEDEEEEIRGLFHTLWSSQCDPGYDVKQWERLRYLLIRKRIEL